MSCLFDLQSSRTDSIDFTLNCGDLSGASFSVRDGDIWGDDEDNGRYDRVRAEILVRPREKGLFDNSNLKIEFSVASNWEVKTAATGHVILGQVHIQQDKDSNVSKERTLIGQPYVSIRWEPARKRLWIDLMDGAQFNGDGVAVSQTKDPFISLDDTSENTVFNVEIVISGQLKSREVRVSISEKAGSLNVQKEMIVDLKQDVEEAQSRFKFGTYITKKKDGNPCETNGDCDKWPEIEAKFSDLKITCDGNFLPILR